MESSSQPISQAPSPSRAHDRAVTVIEDGVPTGVCRRRGRCRLVSHPRHGAGTDVIHPVALGSVVFLGQSPDQIIVNGSIVFAIRAPRVLFLMAGLVLAWMFGMFEHNPQFGIILLLLFVLFESILFSFAAAIFPNLMGAQGAVAVSSGNLFAAIAMFWFQIRRHPPLGATPRLEE
jgi:hypothetical protein